jgi:hydrogenase-4 component B
MSLPILVLTAACILMAAAPAHVVRALHAAILGVAPAADVESPTIALQPVALLLPALLIATGLCLAVRAMRARAGAPRWDRTWGCGYPAPTARMQYTGASFAAPIVQVMDPVLRTERRRVREVATEGGWAWPVTDRWESRTADRALVALYEPLFGMIARGGARLRRGYRSSLTMSLVFIVATMLILLVLLFAPVTRP